jgi:pimeloyl-ACP methyl ester carboxylesterase
MTDSGRTVLLLHGSGPGSTGATAWAPLVAALTPRFRCETPDLPGFGSAPAAPLEEWIERLAPDEPCAVVGNSAGGAVALALARAYPRVVKKVVAVGTMGYPMPLSAALDALWSSDDARSALELIFPGPVSEAAVAARAEAMRGQPHYLDLFPAPRQRWVDALSLSVGALAEVKQPVLLIHGSEDRIVPLADSVLPLLRTLPDARAQVFGGAGHATPLERTPEFNALVTTFLES